LTSAITRVLPANNVTRTGIAALLDIFTQQANVAKDKIEEQRARQSKEASQRVQTETQTEAL
jgi:ribosomal protein S2